MSKVKINLANGSVVEKPLVTCFKGTNGNYLVLDNETNGSMGLPIICISKFKGTSAEKIFDQNEWAAVKENLKTIIAGTALPYLSVPETITASEDFFTQLTLPVASFDLLKSVYAPVKAEEPQVESPVVEQTPTEIPAAPVIPETSAIGQSSVIAPAPVAPVPAPEIAPQPEIAAPVIDAPVIGPVVPTPEVATTPVSDPATSIISAPVVDAPPVTIEEPTPAPVVEPVAPVVASESNQTTISNDDIITIKENFMKACENMFDALIKKFENK